LIVHLYFNESGILLNFNIIFSKYGIILVEFNEFMYI